jgi:hypothetical protein
MEQQESEYYKVFIITHLFDGTELHSTLGDKSTRDITEKRVHHHFNNLESPNFIFQYSDCQAIKKDQIRLITYEIRRHY